MSGEQANGEEAGRPDGAPHRVPREDWDSWLDAPLEGDERSRSPLFLGRDIYRRRRIMDAARLLPALGAALLLLPMLWAREHGTAAGGVYTFLVWIGLIIVAAFLANSLSAPLRDAERSDGADGEDP